MPVRSFARLAVSTFAVGVALSTGAAGAPVDDEQISAILLTMPSRGQPVTYELLLSELSKPVRMFDSDQDGLDQKDVATAAQLPVARTRAMLMASLLAADLDNDHVVSRAEYQLVSRTGAVTGGQGGPAESDLFGKLDKNGDGLVSIDEMSNLGSYGSRAQDMARSQRSDTLADRLLKLDPGQDGAFTLTDAKTVTDQIFATLDTDSNGIVSQEETQALRKRASERMLNARQQAMAQRQVRDPSFGGPGRSGADCVLPPVGPADQVVVIGAYEGSVTSTAHAGDPSAETSVYTVLIEPGPTPLYVVGTSYEGGIWSFAGAVERISKVVVYGYKPQGVIGLDRSKVAFAPGERGDGCPRASYETAGTAKAILAKTQISQILKHQVDFQGGAYRLNAVSIPSMSITSGDGSARREGSPTMQIDPAAVITSGQAGAYSVLPGMAGIQQLVTSGALVRVSDSNYRLVRAIPYWPARLTGIPTLAIVVATGVPMPKGETGWACVVDEQTGASVGQNMMCR